LKSAKTIQIFLPDGNPRGVRVAEITSRTEWKYENGKTLDEVKKQI